MDKEYLIHNIDYKDNPEDQHLTIDITISDLEIADQDVTATVGINTFVNGILTRGSKNEDVSLTGAGGGGDTATITVNYFLEGDPLPNIAAAGINWWYYGEDDSNHHWGNAGIQVNETPYTFTIPIIPESTLIGPFCIQTNDNFYIPFNNISITGDAVWNADKRKYIISGDATINCEMIMD